MEKTLLMKLIFKILSHIKDLDIRFPKLGIQLVIAIFLSLGGLQLSSQIIYTYSTDLGGAYASIAANMTATGLTRINGAVASGFPCTQGYTSNGFPGTTTFNAPNACIEFSMTPNLGYQLDIYSIQAINGRNNLNGGPTMVIFAYSFDGVTWLVGNSSAAQVTTSADLTSCTTFAGTDVFNMTNFSTPNTLYFRVYPCGSSIITGDHFIRNLQVLGALTPVVISGCTNSIACNYNPVATVDNGTCSLPGCMDNTACNYVPTAICQGSVICTYPTCLDPTACNFNICPGGACVYIGGACDDANAGTGPDIYGAGCICSGPPIGSPFNGIAVKEVAIPAGPLATIDAQLVDPAESHCYRVFACFNDPLWELQALYSNPLNGQDWWLHSTTNQFYRHPVANAMLGTQVNPIFFGPFPEMQYDSWFTIKQPTNAVPTSLLVVESGPGPGPSDPPLPLSTWNASIPSGNLDITGVTSYAGTAITNITSTPTSTGMPDALSQVLIGQFTSDGTITANFNLQFRKMTDAAGTIYSPNTTIQQPAVQFIAPASDTLCQMVLLPISLLSFNAEIVVEDRVDLVWVTQTEINNELFLIERSPDGVNDWIAVNQMPGAGNSQQQIYYRSFDFHPLEGLNFYRLKQIDTHGAFSYSQVEYVEFHHAGNIQVWPNPNDGTILRLGGDTFGLDRFAVRSMDGKIVANQKFTSADSREILLESYNLAQGMYSLELYKAEKVMPQVVKMIIN
jgi:hypothetical protein